MQVIAEKTKEYSFKTDNKGHYAELKLFADAIIDGNDWPIPLWQQVQATEIALKVEEKLLRR